MKWEELESNYDKEGDCYSFDDGRDGSGGSASGEGEGYGDGETLWSVLRTNRDSGTGTGAPLSSVSAGQRREEREQRKRVVQETMVGLSGAALCCGFRDGTTTVEVGGGSRGEEEAQTWMWTQRWIC